MHKILFILILLIPTQTMLGCKKTPITVINHTGTNMINGYFTGFPEDFFNLLEGESKTVQHSDSGFPDKDISVYFAYTSPIYGQLKVSNIYLIKDWHNNVTINSDNTATVIQ